MLSRNTSNISGRTLLTLLALILAVLGRPAAASAQGNQSFRVGEVIIIGNTEPQDRVIREQLPFGPGDRVTYADLKKAERRLERLGLFVVDPANGVYPTILVREPEFGGEFWAVEIHVQEAPTNFIRYAACDLLIFLLTGNLEYLESALDRLQRCP